jgi:hypothetical protein
MKLRLKPDAARRLVWSPPDGSIAPFCSLCQAHIPEDTIPLRMWTNEGACVQFCDGCVESWFEVKE